MDRRERYEDFVEQLRAVQDDLQGRVWTAIPGIIQKWEPQKMTCDVLPAIQAKWLNDQVMVDVTLPLLINCPVVFPSGGGAVLTFPIKKGDECLIVIACRCIDSWWQSGGVQVQQEFRMHDLSDGFVLPQVWSQPRVIQNISTDSVQLRTTDGANFYELKEDGNVTVETTQNITMNAAQDVTINAGGKMHLTAATEIRMTAPIIYEN
jgi:hypothetical protein